MGVTDLESITELVRPLTVKITECLASQNTNITNITCSSFYSEEIKRFIIRFKQETFPLLAPIMDHLGRTHYSESTRNAIIHAVSVMLDIDFELYVSNTNIDTDFALKHLILTPEELSAERFPVEAKWALLEFMAKRKKRDLVIELPYHETRVIKEIGGDEKN